MPVYAITIFLSAFLLFQVQPMIAKMILPWFGGSAAVWSAALLFFQLLLLAGYLYAHATIRYLRPRQQVVLHIVLLAISFVVLPITPSASWKPTSGDDPTFRILGLLGATIGLPYALLSSTSPLLQAWYVRRKSQAVPYRLFALSNLGSMLALLSYPAVLEPWLPTRTQAFAWSVGYIAFAAVCAVAGWRSRTESVAAVAAREISAERVSPKRALFWVGLAACASTLLLSVTAHLTQNVAPIPLLWVAPLSLYLLSFILCFESDRFYNRAIFLPLLVLALAGMAYAVYAHDGNLHIRTFVPLLAVSLFVCCMVCHGEIARSRPAPKHLTFFYLMVSIGGALGGLFVALLAPRIFKTYLEMPLAMMLLAALLAAWLWKEASKPWMKAGLASAALALTAYLAVQEVRTNRLYLYSGRNFYGVLRVYDTGSSNDDGAATRVLVHGTINHGTQLLAEGFERTPTSYFGRYSGIGRAMRTLHEKGRLKIGILGLGAGVTATLAEKGDTLYYYEINPLVVEIANSWFKFLKHCPAQRELFLGDGRLVLERQPSQQFDLLAMDAFTSDAVPVHLLTREAFETYMRQIKPDGVLAINISNRYLDLEPVVARAAEQFGRRALVIHDDGEEEDFYTSSTWILLSANWGFFDSPHLKGAVEGIYLARSKPNIKLWTDDYSNIIQILQ
jgi:hypothetical protein